MKCKKCITLLVSKKADKKKMIYSLPSMFNHVCSVKVLMHQHRYRAKERPKTEKQPKANVIHSNFGFI